MKHEPPMWGEYVKINATGEIVKNHGFNPATKILEVESLNGGFFEIGGHEVQRLTGNEEADLLAEIHKKHRFMENLNSFIKEQAIKSGINPGHCGVCGAGLVVSNRIPFAKCGVMSLDKLPSNIFSFDCPNSPEHIEAPDLEVHYVYGN
jgi:hypothetical protein